MLVTNILRTGFVASGLMKFPFSSTLVITLCNRMQEVYKKDSDYLFNDTPFHRCGNDKGTAFQFLTGMPWVVSPYDMPHVVKRECSCEYVGKIIIDLPFVQPFKFDFHSGIT